MNLDLLYKDADVEVKGDRELLASCERVMFSFTGGGLNEGKTRVQTPEFVGTSARQGGLIVVTDLWRSWGNHVDWQKVNEAIAPLIEGKPLYSIGNSMGGFLSILATRFFPIQTAIAFVPQFTWHREVISEETRWTRYRRNVRIWNYVTLTDAILPDRTYYVFYGADETADLAHARCFPPAPNLHRYMFPGEGHGVASGLKAAGVLDEVVGACVAGTFSLDLIRDRLNTEPYEMDQSAPAAPHPVPKPEDAPDPSSWPQPHPREMTQEQYEAWEARRTERHARLTPEERRARQERRAARRAELDAAHAAGTPAAPAERRDRANRPDRAAREAARAARGGQPAGQGGAERGAPRDQAAREARRAALLAARAEGGGRRRPERPEGEAEGTADGRSAGRGDRAAREARRAELREGLDAGAIEARRAARAARRDELRQSPDGAAARGRRRPGAGEDGPAGGEAPPSAPSRDTPENAAREARRIARLRRAREEGRPTRGTLPPQAAARPVAAHAAQSGEDRPHAEASTAPEHEPTK